MEFSECMDVKEAALFLNVSAWTIYEYCRQGIIPHRRIGRRILISRSILMNWLKEKENLTQEQTWSNVGR